MSEADLTALLKELSAPNADVKTIITPTRVGELSVALSPGSDRNVSSLGLLALSKIVDLNTGGTEDENAARLKAVFDPLVSSAIAKNSEDPADLVPSVSLLANLAPLAPAAVVETLTQPLGLTKDEKENDIDPLAILLEFAELPSPLQTALAGLCAALAGTKQGRALVRSRALAWVEAAADAGGNAESDAQVLCAVTLSKLGRGEAVPGEPEEERLAREQQAEEGEERYAKQLAAHIKTASPNSPALLSTLEGLSVLTTRPAVRDVLCSDPAFLKALLALSPVPHASGGSLPITPRDSMVSLDESTERPVDGAVCYGLTTILVNLTARKPVLSTEDAQMDRLRRMALSGKTKDEADPHESEEAVKKRVDALVSAGVISAMSGLARAGSLRVKTGLGQLSLGIVDDRSHRASFVRDGGFRVLSHVIRDLTAKDTSKEALPALQALAKMVISVPPQLLFPAPSEVNALNALRPLELLLCHSGSNLLQKFEALMALTNLASVNPEFGDRIVMAELPAAENALRGAGSSSKTKVVDVVETLMLDDNTLVQRAATELVCNLVNCEKGYMLFSGETESGSESANPRAAARLGILLLLTDADDMATRQAASGALASLTDSAAACRSLFAGGGISTSTQRNVWDRVGELFAPGGAQTDEDGERIETISSEPPDVGLAHRGAVILANLTRYLATDEGEKERKEQTMKMKEARVEEKLGRGAKALMGGGAETKPALEAVLEALKGMRALEVLVAQEA